MLAAFLVVLGLVGAGRVAWVAVAGPPGGRPVAAQVDFLVAALDGGAGPRMQALFPEGELFMHVLTGLAATAENPDVARAQLAAADRPDVADRFGSGLEPEHGTFHAGWTLLLAVAIAEATGDRADRDAVADRAPALFDALLASPTGVPASYPGGYWPCDAVVAGAALVRAADLLGQDAWLGGLQEWRTRIGTLLDDALRLLPHRVDAAGAILDPPRGSSQAIVQAFWPTVTTALDGAPEEASWLAFREAFVVRVGGLVGVREYPVGSAGEGDVDSGPLLAGVSLSASAVTLAAARANGDAALATDLDREAELLGLPLQVAGQRRYALGILPVGDGFLAWARSVPLAPGSHDPHPRPLWALLSLPGAVLIGGGLLLARAGRARATPEIAHRR